MELSLELDYIAALTRSYFREDPAPLPAPADLDWERFLHLCFDHRITGAVLPLVDRESMRPEMAMQLDPIHGQAVRETGIRLMFLQNVLEQLEAAGCRPLVLKGAPMATRYYQRPGDRYMADLDLLVAREEVDAACAALAGLGLKRAETRAAPEFYRDHHFHWILSSPAGYVVEIHWGLSLPRSIYRYDLEGIAARAQIAPLGEREMRIPSATDLLLHIVGQCTAGGFGELRRVMDAALLYQAVTDRKQLMELARRQNQGPALWALLQMVQRYTGVEIDPVLMTRLHPSARTARLLVALTDRVVFGRKRVSHRDEVQELLHWLCAPSSDLRRRELRRYLAPGPEFWLEAGYSREDGPPVWKRAANRLSRLKSVAYLAGIALLELIRPRSERSPHPA